MARVNVIMPQMGESISEGTLTRWHKKVGESVQREQVLFEISTDKVDTEIPAPVGGTLVEVLAKEGDVVKVNTVVAIIDDAAGASAGSVAPAAKASTAQASEPAKAAPQAEAAKTAPGAPQSASASAAKDSPAQVNAVSQDGPEREGETAAAAGEGDRKLLSSPLVRKMAAEHNIDLARLSGTGEGGRIVKQDLLNFLDGSAPKELVGSALAAATQPAKTAPTAHVEATGGAAAGVDAGGVRFERVPMTQMRKKIAEHMVMSKRTSPHVTSIIEVDVQKIVDLRAKLKDKFEAANGFKLTFMPFFLQAAVEGLKAVPIANSSVEGDAVLYKKDINLGVAVALDGGGLIVPVIKNAGERNFTGLGRELNNLAEKARTKKLSPDDVKGGTFSVSNYGGFGTVIGQPIINQPQVAIMGLGAMTKKAVVVNDAIAIRTMVYVVITFDHRVMDGSDSGKFLSTVKNVLENWSAPVL